MKLILTPCVGISYYPQGDIIVKNCKLVDIDIIHRAFVQYFLANNSNQELPKLSPEYFKQSLQYILNRYEDSTDCFVLDKEIEQLFIMNPALYALECAILKNVWIPESWKK